MIWVEALSSPILVGVRALIWVVARLADLGRGEGAQRSGGEAGQLGGGDAIELGGVERAQRGCAQSREVGGVERTDLGGLKASIWVVVKSTQLGAR